ncbi:MAG: LacI family DNA-binding transcriptional regulator [Candidatus Bipolaricaulota bacterium]|nr:LacI family DNA-binding transcriptional regulator [Candidatus Bipolaricaulota bacterium]
MTTMKEVAERAGVSVTTVSHVINGTRYVSPELTERVEKAIEGLDYHPDPLAQGLSKGKTNTLALVVSDVANPFFPKVARGVEDCALENDYSTILCNTDEDTAKEKKYLSLLIEKNVDGLIVAPASQGTTNLSVAMDRDVPLVLIDRFLDQMEVDQVYSNNFLGSKQGVEHLIELGHERIGIISEINTISTFSQRIQGYREALEKNKLPYKEEYVRQAGLEIEGAYQAAESLLTHCEEITAIFSTNDLMTEGILQYFKDDDIQCPEEVSLLAFDDPTWASSFNPSITAIAQRPYDMGYRAASLLFKRMKPESDTMPFQRVELPVKLNIRESTVSPKGVT